METLVNRAMALPTVLETLVKRQAEAKYRLCDLIESKRRLEDRVAGEVAAGLGQYANAESRRGEIQRRLQGNAEYQQMESDIQATRQALVELDASVARAQGDMATVNSLLSLLAAAVHSGNGDIGNLISNAINLTVQVTQADTATPEAPATPAQNEALREIEAAP